MKRHMGDIEKRLKGRNRRDTTFADKVKRLIQPEALKQQKPWLWSPGDRHGRLGDVLRVHHRRPRER